MWYTLYELRVCVYGEEKERERECKREREREQKKRSEGECASATFILCCARKNVNYSKVRPAITYHLLFQIITICSKCNIKKKKKKNYRYHEIKYSVRKHEDVSLFRTFLVLRKGERHLYRIAYTCVWIRFVKTQQKHASFSCVKIRCDRKKSDQKK